MIFRSLLVIGGLTISAASAQSNPIGWGPYLDPNITMHVEGEQVYACPTREGFVRAFEAANGRPADCPHLIPGDRIKLLSSSTQGQFVQIKVVHMNGSSENLWISNFLLYNDEPGWRSP